MRMRLTGIGTVAFALIVAVVLHAPGMAMAQAKEIKIGGTMAVTGNFAVEWGPKAKQFMEEWAAMMNERGGVAVKDLNAKLPIKLIVYDDGSNADRAVELYAAIILHAVDIPPPLFTAMFAIGRTAGWTAHMIEQLQDNRIIRPASVVRSPRPRSDAGTARF